MRLSVLALPPILVACFACTGGVPKTRVDSGPDEPDAAPLPCSALSPLVIGQCIDTNTDAPCLDSQATTRSWISLETQPIIRPIIGLQGSPMFVMSASGANIDPGSDSDSPAVEVSLTQGDQDVGAYQARPTVIDDPAIAGNVLAPQLFVVSFFADDMMGQMVEVEAKIKDRNGDRWCSEGSFQIGELVPALPLP